MRDHTCIVAGVALVLVLIYEYFMDRVDLLSKALRPSGMAALDPLLPACPGHLRLWQVRKRNIHLSAILMENNRQSAATPLADSRRAALRLLIKAFVFLLPFWAAVVLYLHDDPYMSLHRYRVYDSPVVLNENFVGWGIYCNHRHGPHAFNSFIMGNSCTMAYRCAEWERYLPHGAHAMRLFGNAESLAGLDMSACPGARPRSH